MLFRSLLYEDQYTIAGAKKRLAHELRGGGKLRPTGDVEAPHDYTLGNEDRQRPRAAASTSHKTAEDREALKKVATELREILALLEKQNKTFASSKK